LNTPAGATRHEQLAALFDELVALPPDARAERLLALEPSLRNALQALLQADASHDDPLVEAITLPEPPTVAAGGLLGDYRVLRELGAGGMGTVLLAERADGVYAQQVAIKLIRGFPTADGQRRLRQERQILASLDHPYIAHLLDGGETVDGQPFVVMEYVDGLPLLAHIADQQLGLDARLALFDRIAAAVQHAHQRLVIHRDIKPGNVLVRGDGTPKLLDFGIAKLVDVSAGSDPRQTSTRLWTPGYASPEQQRGEAITTATDVYALGVLLREMLCGRQPAQPADDYPQLAPDAELRGLLDMATATAAAARYATVQALRDDLARYRDSRPLRARADHAGYRLRKFLGRHRIGALSALLALALATGFVWQLALQRDRALAAESAAGAARDDAEREAAASRAALDFLTTALSALAPEDALSTEVSVRALLDRARAQLDARRGDDPRVRRSIQRQLGHLYQAIGEPRIAEQLFAAGLAGADAVQRAEALALARDHQGHASVLATLERGADSLAAAQAAQALRERFAADDPVERLLSLEGLAFARYSLGEYDAADTLWTEALALAAALPAAPLDSVLNMQQAQGSMLVSRGEAARALALGEAGWALAEAHLPAESPARVNLLRLRGEALLHLGDAAAAEPLVRQAIALQQRTVGERGNRLGTLYNALGIVLNELGRYREALQALERAQGLHTADGHGRPLEDAIGWSNLAAVYENAGDYPRALALFERASQRAAEGDGEPDLLVRRMLDRAQARCLALAGQHAAARERLLDLQRRALALDGEASFEYAATTWQLALVARRARDPAAGRPLLALAHGLFSTLLPDSHPLFAHTRRADAAFARMEQQAELAERRQREAIERLQATASLPVDLAIARAELAAILFEAGREAEAGPLLDATLPVLRDSLLPTEVARQAAEALAASR
jgi:eukaryotic-like serine/threonine-protein kinase